jgi:hypothetical protein
MIKKILLFIIPFLIMSAAVVGYFKLTQKISTISIPSLPSVSFSDIAKLSRFSLEKAPSESLTGSISSMSGDIEYESRTATEAAKINSPVTVQQGESLSTGVDGKLILTFNGAAEVDFSPNTSVGIIQTLPADVVFSQTSGVAEYKKLVNIPVTIRTLHLLTENDGDITVTLDDAAPFVTVSVNSGSATFAYNNINDVSRVLTVPSGKRLIFNDYTRRVVLE